MIARRHEAAAPGGEEVPHAGATGGLLSTIRTPQPVSFANTNTKRQTDERGERRHHLERVDVGRARVQRVRDRVEPIGEPGEEGRSRCSGGNAAR